MHLPAVAAVDVGGHREPEVAVRLALVHHGGRDVDVEGCRGACGQRQRHQ